MQLHRTPVTWAMYGVNGAWASFVYLSGPISPIVADALGVPVTWAGLVGTALAWGLAGASVTGPAAIRRFGRHRAALIALALVALGLIAVLFIPATLGGISGYFVLLIFVLLLSTAGGTAMNTSTAVLAETHPQHSARVITEANAVAGWVGLLSPLMLGLALGAGWGWPAGVAFALLAVIAAGIGLLVADRAILGHPGAGDLRPVTSEVVESMTDMSPESAMASAQMAAAAERAEHPHAPGNTLPRVFWIAMVALFAAAASEFAINFWGSALIQEQTGAPASAATAAMSASVAGIALGRTLGSGLTARIGPHRMLLAGFALALLGFALLWASGAMTLSVVGLLMVGLGLATLFPLILDRAILLSAGKPDLALARVALILGLAIGGAPFVLGALGAVMPVQMAMLLVPVIILAGVAGVVHSKVTP